MSILIYKNEYGVLIMELISYISLNEKSKFDNTPEYCNLRTADFAAKIWTRPTSDIGACKKIYLSLKSAYFQIREHLYNYLDFYVITPHNLCNL